MGTATKIKNGVKFGLKAMMAFVAIIFVILVLSLVLPYSAADFGRLLGRLAPYVLVFGAGYWYRGRKSD